MNMGVIVGALSRVIYGIIIKIDSEFGTSK